MAAPKRHPRAFLATGGLFLIPLAAFGLVLSGRHPVVPVRHQATPASVLSGAETALPPARVAAGAATQGDFTLLAVTRITESGFLTPPIAVGAQPGAVDTAQVMGAGDATGLWIGVQGGIGFQALTPPMDDQRHVYPFGPATLVVDETRPPGYSAGWYGPDGVSRIPEGQCPYEFKISRAAASAGHPASLTLTLIPCRLADRFLVAAQPLDEAGHALGRPVPLVCQPVTPQALFAQIPTAYSGATRQFQVTVTRRGTRAGVSWRLAGLPPAVRNGLDDPPPAIVAGFGPLTIRAAAAEAADFSGYPDFWNRHLGRDAGGGWTLTGPQNLDNHLWTGVPSIRLLLADHNSSPDHWNQLWTIEVDRITPQWGPSAAMRRAASGRSSFAFPVYYHGNGAPTTAWPFVSQDWQVGAAYPGQQRWVRVDGAAIRSAAHMETLTFHDAEVVHDAGFGGNRVVWRHPETETTPSGISVTVLNGRPGVPDQGAGLPYAPVWRFDHGSAEMLLAWHLPHGIVSQEHAAFNDPREADLPKAAVSLSSEWDISHPLLWDALAAPGEPDSRALMQAGYGPLRFSVRSTAPLPPPPAARREGLYALELAPLPPRLKTITLQIGLREEEERHFFRLLVPVRAAFPQGWDADAADSRSREFP